MRRGENKKHRHEKRELDGKADKRAISRREKGDAPELNERRAIDWSPLFEAAEQALIWAHDLARDVCEPDECAAVERTFRSLYARLDGREAEDVPAADMLSAFRAIGRAVETELGLWRGSFDLLADLLGIAFARSSEMSVRTQRTGGPLALVGLAPANVPMARPARGGMPFDLTRLVRAIAGLHAHA